MLMILLKQLLNEKIGTATNSSTISKTENIDKESPVGNLVTTAQLTIAKKTFPTVDFAMTNNGGIRSDLVVKNDRTITWEAAQAVQPFGNILQVIQMTGQHIYDVLNQQYDENQTYFLQMSGLTYTYTDNDPKNSDTPFKIVKVYKDNGEEINLTTTYTVVVNDFLYGGGDGFSAFKKAKLIGAINTDTEAFITYITNLEASGKTVNATIKGVKNYVTSNLESSTKVNSAGKHSIIIISKVFRNRDGNIVSSEIISDLLTSTENTNNSFGKKEITTNKNTISNSTLPITGDNYKMSPIMTILALISLGGLNAFIKKRKS